MFYYASILCIAMWVQLEVYYVLAVGVLEMDPYNILVFVHKIIDIKAVLISMIIDGTMDTRWTNIRVLFLKGTLLLPTLISFCYSPFSYPSNIMVFETIESLYVPSWTSGLI